MEKLNQKAGIQDYERANADTLRQLAQAKTANSPVVAKPAPLDDCKRLGIDLTWFAPAARKAKGSTPLAHVNAVGVRINKLCRVKMGDVPLKVDIAKQGKGYIVLRFAEQGLLVVTPLKDGYGVKRKGLVPWLESQGVALGSYPIEWDAETNCLYLRLSGHIPSRVKGAKSDNE